MRPFARPVMYTVWPAHPTGSRQQLSPRYRADFMVAPDGARRFGRSPQRSTVAALGRRRGWKVGSDGGGERAFRARRLRKQFGRNRVDPLALQYYHVVLSRWAGREEEQAMLAILLLAALGSSIPTADINKICANAQVDALPEDRAKALRGCVGDETSARDQIKREWN